MKTTPTSAPKIQPPEVHQNSMCPSRMALAHPAVGLLPEWAILGCPTCTGKPWTRDEMWEVVARGPHQSALSPEALAHFAEEAAEKVRTKQARIVLWDDIKDNPPKQLKISLITAIPHKSKRSAPYSISPSDFDSRMGGYWRPSTTPQRNLSQKRQLTRLGIACHK